MFKSSDSNHIIVLEAKARFLKLGVSIQSSLFLDILF